jgi:hypothetical protein
VRGRRFLLLFPLAGTLVLAAAVLPLVTGAETLFLRDVFGTHLPLQASVAQALEDGRVPLVDPYRAGGQPLAGNPNALTFYPTTLLHLAAPLLWAFNAHYWLHLLLAPFAAYWLGRAWGLDRTAAWACGATYAASGWFLSHLAFYNLLVTATLAPALAAAALDAVAGRRPRRSAAAFGLLWALLLLAGEPLMLALSLGLSAAAVLAAVPRQRWRGARRPVLLLALAAAVGTLAALPQVVELLRILPASQRGLLGYEPGGRTIASFDPRQAVEWLLPHVFGRADRQGFAGFWGAAYYGGWRPYFASLAPGVLALALVAAAGRPGSRAAWWGWGVAGLGFFLALGRFNPVAELLFSSLPLLRYPVKLWLWVAAGGALLAGLGFGRLVGGDPAARRRFLAVLALLGLLLAAAWVVLTFMPATTYQIQQAVMPEEGGRGLPAIERPRWQGIAELGLAVVAGGLLLARLGRRRPVTAGALLLLLHLASQLVFHRPAMATDDAGFYETPPSILALLPPDVRAVHGGGGLPEYPDPRMLWLFRRAHLEQRPELAVPWGRRFELDLSTEELDTLYAAAAVALMGELPDAKRLELLRAWGVGRLVLERPLPPDLAGEVRLLGRSEVFGVQVHVYEILEPAAEAVKVLIANRGEIAVRVLRGSARWASARPSSTPSPTARACRCCSPTRPTRSARRRRGRATCGARRSSSWPGRSAPTPSTPATASSPRTPASPACAARPGSSSSARRPRRSPPWARRSRAGGG